MPIDKQDSNLSGLAYAEETTLGVLPGTPIWHRVEPNNYASFGAQRKMVARNPINPSRQRKKGSIVGKDVSAGFSHDFVMTDLNRLLQSFFFAAAREKDDTAPLNGTAVAITAVTDGGATDAYEAASGLGGFIVNQLVLASGFSTAANNGLQVLDTVAAGSLGVVGDLTPEAAPPAAARVQAVGYQFPSGDATLVVAANGISLVSATIVPSTLGLTPGEWVYIGGDGAGLNFVEAANKGYARIYSITDATKTILFDQSTFTAVNDAGTAKTVQIFFGTVIRNEKTPSLITRRSVQFERTIGADATADQSEYAVGSVANEIKINLPLEDKVTVDMTFIAIGHELRDGTTGIKAGTRVEPVLETAINTSSDVVRSHLAIHDPDNINSAALVGFVTDGSISIANGVKPNKAIGRVGAFSTSAGTFTVDATLNAYFSTIDAVEAIDANSDVGYNLIVAKDNQGFVFDLPLLTVGGGEINVVQDEPIMLPLENAAAEGAIGYTAMYCSWAYLPTQAMPA